MNTRSVVNIQSLRGYDHINRIPGKVKKLNLNKGRHCTYEDCSTKLSMYNDTEYCSKHERFNPNLSKNI